MSIATRTTIANIIRQHNQGLLSDTDAYHAICNLIAQGD